MKTSKKIPAFITKSLSDSEIKYLNNVYKDKTILSAQNPYTGQICKLDIFEYTVYNHIIELNALYQRGLYSVAYNLNLARNWFRKNNIDAYSKLID